MTHNPRVNYAEAGICFRESSSGKLQTFGIQNSTICVASFNNETTWSTNLANSWTGEFSRLIFFRIQDNGTNRIYSFGFDGQHFTTYYTVARTTFLTADEVGFYVDAENNAWPASATLLSWKVE